MPSSTVAVGPAHRRDRQQRHHRRQHHLRGLRPVRLDHRSEWLQRPSRASVPTTRWNQRLARPDRRQIRRGQPARSGIDLNQRKIPPCSPRLRVAGGRPATPPTAPTASPSTRPSWPSPSRSWSTTTTTAGTEGNLIVYGSIQQFARGPVGTFKRSKQLLADHRLREALHLGPAARLCLATELPGSFDAPWALGSVTTNAGADSASVCPPLLGVYSGLRRRRPDRSRRHPVLLGIPGGLPGYPSSTAPSPPTSVTASQIQRHCDGELDGSRQQRRIHHHRLHREPESALLHLRGYTVCGAGATSATITGMPAGSRYTFTVTATNANGTSSPSSASNSVIIPAAPTAPTGVTATVNTNGTVTVSWTASPDGSTDHQLHGDRQPGLLALHGYHRQRQRRRRRPSAGSPPGPRTPSR